MACGEVGLAIDYFYSLTPRQFDNILAGYREKEQRAFRYTWEQTRSVMDAVTAPYRKPGAPSLVKKMVFPWEKDMPETAETDLQQLEKVVQENNIKFWGEYDKRKIEA